MDPTTPAAYARTSIERSIADIGAANRPLARTYLEQARSILGNEENTVRLKAGYVETLDRALNGKAFMEASEQDLEAYRKSLKDSRYAPGTIVAHVIGAKALYRWLYRYDDRMPRWIEHVLA